MGEVVTVKNVLKLGAALVLIGSAACGSIGEDERQVPAVTPALPSPVECRMASGDVLKTGDSVWVQTGVVLRSGGTAVSHAVFLDGGRTIAEPTSKMSPDGQWILTNNRPADKVRRFVRSTAGYPLQPAACQPPQGEEKPQVPDAQLVTVQSTVLINKAEDPRRWPHTYRFGIKVGTSDDAYKTGALGVSLPAVPAGYTEVNPRAADNE